MPHRSEYKKNQPSKSKGTLSLGELILIGVGGIVGAGFFLGVGSPIRTAGPSVLIAFLLGAFITAQVTGAVTSIATHHPVEGSFKVYADLYLGHFAGYMQGWIYYVASVMTIASEAVAMSVFTRVWLPNIPLWILSLVYSAIILLINAFGVKNFGRVESFMSVIKIAALVGFILFVGGALLFAHGSTANGLQLLGSSYNGFFPHGWSGVWQSMLIVVFAYAGIGVFATAAAEVRDVQEIERGALWTILLLTLLYLISIGGVLLIEPWQSINTNTSPFVLALQHAGMPVLADIFNAVVLVASFSVMAGAVFSANQILVSLGQDHEAPQFVTKMSRRNVPYGALASTAVGILIAIGAAYGLPANVYRFLISASSFMTFFYWFVMLLTFVKWRRTEEGKKALASRLAFGSPFSTFVTMIAIGVLTVYALFQKDQRIAFYAFLVITMLIGGSYAFVRKRSSVK
ncbi:hypothetical protein BM613_11995 [Sulfoacidibacillus thermotolerans]|uniref:Amino acid permease/ SLC12A domain-containing protein n=1 Tax=Sulfoacidibacillus thermotolerans TaxID=1765684 RepID=A0A2U3D689_SULT2|nr:hypothetical protein BM613_11995 [Sulfoacidibacillus thermotolerans]